jgi:hypothetical protein
LFSFSISMQKYFILDGKQYNNLKKIRFIKNI